MFRRSALSLILLTVMVITVNAQQPRRRQPDRQRKLATHIASENVKVERDLVYGEVDDRQLQLDLYLPKEPIAEPIPCIIVIHGGGWRSGNETRFASKAAWFADHGLAAACIGYRLLPSVKFPAPVEDCKAAVRWVRTNADKYGIDPDRLGAFGGSAGAHLTAMLATSHKVAELEGSGGNKGVSSRISAAVALATPADMHRYAQRNGASEELAALISPISHVDADSAPILLAHSKADRTVPYQMSLDLAAKYKEAGAEAEVELIEEAPHAFWNMKQWFDDTMQHSLEFFKQHLVDTK